MIEATQQAIRDALHGVAEVGIGERGLTLHRLPSQFAMYHDVDSLTQKVADQASGVRLVFETRATHIQVEYRATLDRSLDGSYVAAPSSVTVTCGDFEQTVRHANGDYRVWNGDRLERLESGENSVATFELPPSERSRVVEIWLPHNCNIELVAVRSDTELLVAQEAHKRWVHYGSSISHGTEAEEPTGVWPVVASRELGLDLYSLGLAGSANLEQFAARVIASHPADLITLKVGINPVNGRNMTRRTFVPAVHAFIDTIRQALPKAPIVLISPIYCLAHEELPGPTSPGPDGKASSAGFTADAWVQDLTLQQIRADLEQIVSRRDDANLQYMNGLDLFGEEDFHLMPDGLHPNAKGYRLIGERFAKLIEPLVLSL